MKHPTELELIACLYREATPEQTASLERHLSQCIACSEQFKRLQSTAHLLDTWELPAALDQVDSALSGLSRAPVEQPALGTLPATTIRINATDHKSLLRFPRLNVAGIAAAIVALATFAAGHWFATVRSEASFTQWRTEFETSLRQELTQQLTRETRQHAKYMHAIGQAQEEQLASFAQSSAAAHEQNRQFFLQQIQTMDNARVADYASLRQDLEVVALEAESQFDQTRERIGRLASFTLADSTRAERLSP